MAAIRAFSACILALVAALAPARASHADDLGFDLSPQQPGRFHVAQDTDAPAASTGEQVISPQAAQETVHMMESVATTGYAASALKIPGYRVSAKTGTAEMSDGSGAYGGAYLTSMAGMAPSDDPQYVVSVTIRKPVTITSGLAAAPVFQKVLSQVLKTYRVQPSTVPAPELPTTY